MGFKKIFRGYDPEEVDKFLADTAAHEKSIRSAQKERIDELSEENYTLRQQLKQYQADEQAISKSLIASQQLAQELKNDAEKYSDLVLSRAKIFYAAWRAYSKTLVAALSTEEVREFNKLQKKLENTINAYEGSDVAKEVEEELALNRAAVATTAPTQQTVGKTTKTARNTVAPTVNAFDNPIDKVEQAAEQAIDLKELTQPQQSLEELCQELGLLKRQ
ncbi:MAG: DivIVA domain-containing protein [Clostridiales bacterium]|nr:DivIVA domain-containing protein [Clostridiales bacterium]